MLAYVFWHVPRAESDADAYEGSLTSFHETFAVDPPDGFRSSAVFRHYALPWAPPSLFVYEDWYVVDDFAALGALNDAAVEASRRPAHDAAAGRSAWGAGGVYRPLGDAAATEGGYSYWLSKPEGMGYEAFYDVVGEALARRLWRRQMVLGPAPEFCLLSGSRLAGPDVERLSGFESAARTVYASGS